MTGSLYLGVDGGGTKTAFALLGEDGAVLAEHRGPGTYYLRVGWPAVRSTLEAGVDAVLRAGGARREDVTYAYFGLPAYGECGADLARFDALGHQVLGHRRYATGNDMVCGWAGSLAGADGVNVVAGTGAISYGEHDGRAARVGGWGELFGDEGSGYWIGRRALTAFARMSDGREPRGPLYGLLRERLHPAADLDVVEIVHHWWRGARERIAALCPTVAHAADLGDDAARAILDDAGGELAQLVETNRRVLGYRDDEVAVVSYSGGVLGIASVLASLTDALHAAPGTYDLRPPVTTPVVGSALTAMLRSGRQVPTCWRPGLARA